MATRKTKRAPARARGVKKAAVKKAATRVKAPPSRWPARRQPESLRLRSFSPSFTANDLKASVAFYTNALGFTVGETWTDGGELRGVTLKAGTCELSLSQDDWAKGRDRKKGEAVRIWCEAVQDIDALAARIQAAGGRLIEEPTTHEWGVRSLSVDDPDGFHLTIYREL